MACFITVRAFDVKDNVPFLWSRAVSHKPAIESTPFSDMITKRTVWSEQTASIMLQPWIICVCTHIYMPKHLISLIIQCTKGIVSKWGVRDEKFASGLCFVVCFGGLFRRSVSGYVSGVCFTKVELPSLTWSWSPQKKYKPIYIYQSVQPPYNKKSHNSCIYSMDFPHAPPPFPPSKPKALRCYEEWRLSMSSRSVQVLDRGNRGGGKPLLAPKPILAPPKNGRRAWICEIPIIKNLRWF